MIVFEFEKVPNGLDGVGRLPVLHQGQLSRRGHAVPALEEQVVAGQEEQEEGGTQIRRQEDERQGRVSRCSHHLIILLPRLLEMTKCRKLGHESCLH